MSVFTNLLNLFKWEPEKDGEEEFDIDKALNENWDKLDNKIDAHTKNTQLVHKNATADLSGFMSKEDKEKLDNIEKEAQSNVIEKIQKNGKDISIANKIVNIVLNKKDVELNNVDNTADLDKPISAATKKALNNKVDKEEGKGLSTNDYTNEDKAKLIPTGGTTGQVLAKKSDADNNVEWVNQTGEGSATGDTLPVGSIMPYPKATAPENWLVCDGSELDRTEYNHLFAIIGTTFGEGDGSTTFNLPNLKGRTIVGLDTNDTDFNTIGKVLGEKTHTLTVAEMPEHTHKFRASTKLGNDEGTITFGERTSGSIISGNYGNAIQKEGSSQSHNNIQPSFVTTYIIKVKQSAGLVATVVDSLESTSVTDALSAKQGKALNNKIMPTVLYMADGNTVKNDIPLNDNVNNYDYLDIQFKKVSGGGVAVGYSRIYKENYEMYNALTSSFSSGDNKVITIYSCIISLAANKITINNGNSIAIKETGIGGFSSANELAILSVRGYKRR